jgi:hypothetical protein
MIDPEKRYHIEFGPEDLYVFKSAAFYRLRDEQRKSPFWGRNVACLSKVQIHPSGSKQ